jgi:DNA polymerase III subunit delta'
VQPVFEEVPGQDAAVAFLSAAAERPHHAYLLGGPEGSGKTQLARAFVASLLCADGGCGVCRDCRLALADRHPNQFVVEPEGRDIHVDTIREEVWQPASRTAPEPGRKVFVIREADRLSLPAADSLLKVLEEPPADTVFLLLSARADELPVTVWSRCHAVTVAALPEPFVADRLVAEGVAPELARTVARLAGGNLGRARRMASEDGLAFRQAAVEALDLAERDVPGALEAATSIMASAGRYKESLAGELREELAPFLDERGRTEEAYRGAVKRLEVRHHRRERRAERDHVDRVLMAMSALLRDRIADAVGAGAELRMHPDLTPVAAPVGAAAAGLAVVEQARAEMAEEFNLNVRLVLERALLGLPPYASR